MHTGPRVSLLALTSIALLALAGCGGGTTANPSTPVVHGDWTWVSGSNSVNQFGSYGTQGIAAPSNTPGSRVYACSGTDKSGNFWLFGGFGDAASSGRDLNDLWKYSNGEWTWVSGSNQTEQPGIYGTKGVPAPGNVPGGRQSHLCWIDTSGSLWVFGGVGIDSTGTRGDLNDLWKYSDGQWTWMSGSNTTTASVSPSGVYGTQGIAAPGNVPGARYNASSWIDSTGNLWLFGGFGWDSTGTPGNLNDLWKYSAGEWTWIAGSNLILQPGVYGTQGTPAPGNTPGARFSAAAWADAEGNLWLFSGEGDSSAGIYCPASPCTLNDLWRYTTAGWTWMGGTNAYNQLGIYGTQGVAALGNIPGGRTSATTWTDAAGNFWLFGGLGMSSTLVFGDLNDLWKYSNGQWTWVSGSNLAAQAGAYGTQGTPAATNVSGCRDGAVGWADTSGNLWLFGGQQIYCVGMGDFNDLWEYQP
jgi:N-acetylneuraminic acid mutarotase